MCKRASLNESLRENFMSQKGKTTSYLRQSLKESQTDVSTSAPLFLSTPQNYRCVRPELLVLYFFCGSTRREHVTFHLNDAKCSTRSESPKMNSSVISVISGFDTKTRPMGQFPLCEPISLEFMQR